MPMVLSAMTAELALVVDSILVSHILGPKEMACVNMVGSIDQLFYGLSVLFALGAEGMISIAIGARERGKANSLYTSAISMIVVTAALITIFGIIFFKGVMGMLTQDAAVEPMLAPYLRVTILGAVPCMLIMGMEIMLQTDGMPELATKAAIVTQVVNLVLDVVFMKFFGMGTGGAALATQCGYCCGLLLIWYVYGRSDRRTLSFVNIFKKKVSEVLKECWGTIKTGLPTAVGLCLISLKIMIIYRILQDKGGVEGAEVYSVAQPCHSMTSIIISGMTDAMVPLVGCLFGEKDYKGTRMLGRFVLINTTLIAGIIALLIIIFPKAVFGMFNVGPEVASEYANSLRFFAISLIGNAATFAMIYYYTAIQKLTPAMILNLVEGFFAVVPVAYLLAKPWGVDGVFAAFVVAELAAMLVILLTPLFVRTEDGKHPDIFLVDKTEPHTLYNASLTATPENASKISRDVINVLKERGMGEETSNLTGLVLEEMTLNICNYPVNAKRPIGVDARVYTTDEGTMVSFRDNGAAFNPLVYTSEEQEKGLLTDSIMVMKSLAKKVDYDRHLSMNQTYITL